MRWTRGGHTPIKSRSQSAPPKQKRERVIFWWRPLGSFSWVRYERIPLRREPEEGRRRRRRNFWRVRNGGSRGATAWQWVYGVERLRLLANEGNSGTRQMQIARAFRAPIIFPKTEPERGFWMAWFFLGFAASNDMFFSQRELLLYVR